MLGQVLYTPKIMDYNFYNFDHEKVYQQFEGDLKYIGTWDFDQYLPYAVYKNSKPNRKKKHKDYLLLFTKDRKLYIMGMDSEEIEKYRYRKGMFCSTCQEVVWSEYQHGYNSCSCLSCSFDGGNLYSKYSGTGKLVTIDLIEKKVV